MSRNGAEGTAAETAPMQRYRELYHLKGRYRFPPIARVRQSGKGQVVYGIELFAGDGRKGRVNFQGPVAAPLPQETRRVTVGLLLDQVEIASLHLLAAQALLVRSQHTMSAALFFGGQFRDIPHHDRLRDIMQSREGFSGPQTSGYRAHRLLAHAIREDIGTALDENARPQTVLPIIVVGNATQGSLDTADNHGHVGIELFEYAGINDGGIVGSHACTAVGGISIVGAQPFVGRVVIDHRIHGSGRHAEEESWPTQLLEVAQVVPPVGLRHDSYTQTFGFQHAAYDRHAKRRVVDISVAREEYHIDPVPPPLFQFLAGGGQPGLHIGTGCLHGYF